MDDGSGVWRAGGAGSAGGSENANCNAGTTTGRAFFHIPGSARTSWVDIYEHTYGFRPLAEREANAAVDPEGARLNAERAANARCAVDASLVLKWSVFECYMMSVHPHVPFTKFLFRIKARALGEEHEGDTEPDPLRLQRPDDDSVLNYNQYRDATVVI
ncbi:hypothetical protein KFE25_010649 [Diacronema lutheri]|uniref:Uncharacterized protein n=1 Tax=Diacronema lutheri TaxID=2081491 RepID=A0A8J6CAX1_DIALT|nr:hypothetical protein KFE25_010649 [Diacronema lutheri]